MKAKAILYWLFLVVTVLPVAGCSGGGRGSSVNNAMIGSQAPGFRLKDLTGLDVSLGQFKGKVVLLDFWATWCGPCRTTMPMLEDLQQEHTGAFTLLAINVAEPPEQVIPYVRDANVKARVLLDIDGQVAIAYRSNQIPMQVLIDQKGIIRHVQLGLYSSMKEDLWAEIARLQ